MLDTADESEATGNLPAPGHLSGQSVGNDCSGDDRAGIFTENLILDALVLTAHLPSIAVGDHDVPGGSRTAFANDARGFEDRCNVSFPAATPSWRHDLEETRILECMEGIGTQVPEPVRFRSVASDPFDN